MYYLWFSLAATTPSTSRVKRGGGLHITLHERPSRNSRYRRVVRVFWSVTASVFSFCDIAMPYAFFFHCRSYGFWFFFTLRTFASAIFTRTRFASVFAFAVILRRVCTTDVITGRTIACRYHRPFLHAHSFRFCVCARLLSPGQHRCAVLRAVRAEERGRLQSSVFEIGRVVSTIQVWAYRLFNDYTVLCTNTVRSGTTRKAQEGL